VRHTRVYIHPSPCPKATVDLEKIAGVLASRGMSIESHPENADAAIVFACGFIDDAKIESIEDILEMVDLKQSQKIRHVVVVGCMPQKYGHELAREFPEVDTFVATSMLEELPQIIESRMKASKKRLWVGQSFPLAPAAPRLALNPAPWTRTIMICDGCSNMCTYCSIPQMRGNLRSRDLADILREVDLVVSQGAREIVIAGQDTASYGKDGGNHTLEDVLVALARRYPEVWIRIAYANPDNLKPSIADVTARYDNICNYLDMPIQHASPRILKAMGRCPDVARLESLVSDLRRSVPDISLRTSVIVGFPGETEADFEELIAFLKRVEFDLVGVFAFSGQPGTPAFSLPGQVPEEVKQDRLVEILDVQQTITIAHMKRLIGKHLRVLVEENEGDNLVGRTQYDMRDVDRVVVLEGSASPGNFTVARVERIMDCYRWAARIVPEKQPDQSSR